MNIAPWENDMILFDNRQQAGQELAERVSEQITDEETVVLALPRGGAVVGFELAKKLNAAFDVIISRKIGMPGNREFGLGAISENGVEVLNEDTIALVGVPQEALAQVIAEEREELQRRIDIYRNGAPLPELRDKTVIVVDDGVATGSTAIAAIEAIRKANPKKLIFAAPVCAYDTAENLRSLVDVLICLASPQQFVAVGQWYREFSQVTDAEVLALLRKARNEK